MRLQRQMRRRQARQGVKLMERTKREHGPLSAALLDLLAPFVDAESLDDGALKKALAMATAAWNAALDAEMERDLRDLVLEGFSNDRDRAEGLLLFEALLKERRARFSRDPRMVVSTEIGYPDGDRRVLAAGMAYAPKGRASATT